MPDNETVNLVLSNCISGALYPATYVKVLIQLGYEPCAPQPAVSFFGKPILVLPGIVGYSSHIYQRSGFGKLYDGVFSYLIHKNLTKFVEDGMTKRLADEEVNEEPDLDVKDFLISTAKQTAAKCVAVTVAHPFHVIFVRTAAQFVGGECTYNSLWASISHIFREEGVSGFFSGLVPSLLYESLVLISTNAMIFLFDSMYTEKNDELAHWPPFLFNMIATSIYYPFVVVTNCMAVTDSGLAIGQPDYMPRFRRWTQCWRWLSSRNELKRGSGIWFARRYMGPQEIIGGCAVPIKCDLAY